MSHDNHLAEAAVSIIIPAYNHEPYIGEAIESILSQTWQDFELIIIDDASQDQTWNKILRYTDPRISASRNSVNQGAHISINKGINQSRGRYITILNSDDRYAPTRIERLLNLAQQQSTADFFAFTDVNIIFNTDATTTAKERISLYAELREFCTTVSSEYWFLAGNPAISTSNFFFSKSLIDKIGPFQALRYTHDWDWAIRCIGFIRPIWLRETLLDYRIHSGNTITEHDNWRHVHENSYIQSHAFFPIPTQLASMPAAPNGQILKSLLNNKSFHPLSLLCFLIERLEGTSDKQLLERCQTLPKNIWWLEQIAEKNGLSPTVFRSLSFLSTLDSSLQNQKELIQARLKAIQNMEQMIVERNHTIENQKSLLEERWIAMQNMEKMINNRNNTLNRISKEQRELQQKHVETLSKYHELQKSYDILNSSRAIRLARFLRRLFLLKNQK